jgi:hypothetical protein
VCWSETWKPAEPPVPATKPVEVVPSPHWIDAE